MNVLKRLIFLILLLTAGINSKPQTHPYPKGAYMSFDEIINRSPSLQLDLKLIKRTIFDIEMNGGNDYKFESEDESIPKKTIKKVIWAYSLGDTLYINCFKFFMQTWYAPLILDGNYLVIRAGLSNYAAEQKNQLQMGYYYGAVGGAIQGAYLASLRFLYVIDKDTRKSITVTPESMQDFLKERTDLLTQFNNESTKEDEKVFIKYLKLYNEN
jgi:hypothetical protein